MDSLLTNIAGNTELGAILSYRFLGNPVERWLLAVVVTVVAVVVLSVARRILVSRLGAFSQRTKTQWDDVIAHMIDKTRFLVLLIMSAYFGTTMLTLNDRTTGIVGAVAAVTLLIQAGLWIHAGIVAWMTQYREQSKPDGATITVMNALGFLSKIGLWTVVLLVALDNVGVKVTAFITGLGIGGVAVALALQNILGDLFASLSIVLDRPFVVGDFLILGDFLGTVENVGLRTTRVRSLSGEQLVISNNDLIKSRLRNYGRMFERRIVFSIGVTYQTPREKIEKIPQMIRQAVENQEKTRFDRSHFKEYGPYSLNFETVYYVLVPDYNKYMDTQQAINLAIHEAFEREEIEFAYPSQTLFVVQESGGEAPPEPH